MIINVPIDCIDPNPFQRRQDYGDIPALAADIKAHGLLQVPRGRLRYGDAPVLGDSVLNLHPNKIWEGGYRVQLAFGHRRLRAYRLLRETTGVTWRTMPVDVLPYNDDQMLDDVWSENVHRADFNPIEQAELLAEKMRLAKAAGGNQETVAREWGIDRSTLANKLRLLRLPWDVQECVRSGTISERKALAMLPAVNGNGEELGELVYLAAEMSSDDIRDRVGEMVGRKRAAFQAGSVPMLVHGNVDTAWQGEMWRSVREGARQACNRCISVIGPAVPAVCKECPGVTLVRALSREHVKGG